MRKFNLHLAALSVILLVLCYGTWLYLLQRPLFVQKPLSSAQGEIQRIMGGGPTFRYRIGSRPLANTVLKPHVLHYQDGQLVERLDWGAFSSDNFARNRDMLDIYIGVHAAEEPDTYEWGISLYSGSVRNLVLDIPPNQDYMFYGPQQIRFCKNKPLILAMQNFFEPSISMPPADPFDKNGNLKPEALETGEIYLLQLEFVDAQEPNK